MDKYTYSLKTDKIQKLVRQGDYATAAKIADTMEWTQEHNVRLLTAVGEAYGQENRYSDAIDILLRAYERSSAGKRILYRLTELAVAGRDLNDAETFYKKYLEEAPEDNNRYILRFRLAEARGEDLEKQIHILETYMKYEFEEEWACKLAELYQKVDRREDCIALCDKIILWFGVGPFVDRAMDLKEMYEPLTASQRDRRENRRLYEEKVQQIAAEMEASRNTPAPQEEQPAPEAGYAVPVTEQERLETEERMANHTAGVDLSVIQEELEKENENRSAEDRLMEAVQASRQAQKDLTADQPAEEVNMGDTQILAELPSKPAAIEEEAPVESASAEEETPDESVVVEEEAPEEPAAVEEEAPEEPVAEPEEDSKVTEENAEPAAAPEETVVIEEEIPQTAEEPAAAPGEDTSEEEQVEAPVEIPAEEEEPVRIDEAPAAEEMTKLPQTFSHENCLFVVVTPEQDTVEAAVEALQDHYEQRDSEMSPVAKILAEKLNRRGLIHSLPQLNHKDLIIEQAGKLSDTMIREMLEVLDYLDTEKVFVLLDNAMILRELRQRMRSLAEENDRREEVEEEELPRIQLTDMEDTVNVEPEEASAEVTPEEPAAKPEAKTAPKQLTSFINLNEKQELSPRDFMRYAEYFADELECYIDDSGMEALEHEMESIRKDGGKLTVGEVEALIEEAADNAEKLTMRRMFSSKYNKQGYLILRKRNFR